MIGNILRGVGQLLLVGLPSWVLLLLTVDASLVPGADVFIITFVQVLFLTVFIIWFRWRVAKRGRAAAESSEAGQVTTD